MHSRSIALLSWGLCAASRATQCIQQLLAPVSWLRLQFTALSICERSISYAPQLRVSQCIQHLQQVHHSKIPGEDENFMSSGGTQVL